MIGQSTTCSPAFISGSGMLSEANSFRKRLRLDALRQRHRVIADGVFRCDDRRAA
jgi:hypothetical protein